MRGRELLNMKENEIILSKGGDLRDRAYSLCQAARLENMITERHDRNAHIVIKPNLLGPIPASEGATTHPQIVEGIILYLRERKFSNLSVCEGSWVGDRTEDSMLVTGFGQLCREMKVPFVDLQKDPSEEKDCAGMKLRICTTPLHADFLINVPVMKGHCQTRMTCALKNMKGCIPNAEKRRFHRLGLHRPIGHLNAGIHQDFILTDAVCPDLTFEDGGNPVRLDTMFCSRDPVLNDSFACSLMKIPLDEVPYIGIAERCGAGSRSLPGARIVTLSGQVISPEEIRRSWESELSLCGNLSVSVKEFVQEVDSCSACYGTLVPVLERLRQEGLLDRLPDRICIGQGYRGKTGRVGIGNCTSCFEHSLAGCPPKEAEMEQYLRTLLCAEEEESGGRKEDGHPLHTVPAGKLQRSRK